jgi:hypothetical protein
MITRLEAVAAVVVSLWCGYMLGDFHGFFGRGRSELVALIFIPVILVVLFAFVAVALLAVPFLRPPTRDEQLMALGVDPTRSTLVKPNATNLDRSLKGRWLSRYLALKKLTRRRQWLDG